MAPNIYSEILVWSTQLASWQNEAIRRLFTKRVLSSTDKDDILQYAQIEHGLFPNVAKTAGLMLTPADLPSPPAPGQSISLKGIRGVTNANALKPNEHLSIGKQLTIIYGENASGKSGYARIMKKAFRARVVDPVLPNVYLSRSGIGPATAIFEIEDNGTVRDEHWVDGKMSSPCLGRFAVFDVKCARVYISENNQLSFLPYGFDIIDGLGGITAEIKKRFQDLAVSYTPKADAIKPFIDETSVGKFLAGLKASTNEKDLRAKAVWSDADVAILRAKEMELAALKAASPQSLRDSLIGKRRQITLIRDLAGSVAEAISENQVAELRKRREVLANYDEAVAAAAKATFGDMDFPGVGTEVWRELLIAAVKYATVANPDQPFPSSEPGTLCVLCLQPLDSTAKERLTRFWEFVQNDVSIKRDAARTKVVEDESQFTKLPRQLPKEIQILEESLRSSKSSVFEMAKAFYISAALRITSIETALSNNVWDSINPEPTSLIFLCNSEIATIDNEHTAIIDDDKVNKVITKLASELAEMNARKRLSEHLTQIVDHLTSLKNAAKANIAASSVTTNSISLKAGELQEKFVTDAFKQKIQQELKPLNLVRVKTGIDRKSEKGKVLHKLIVGGAASVPPESVFSEGERTAISLSCFLAELSASDDNCGIILDDPVSSLDHRVRDAIVKRLVAESKTRQVIIFTHDLACYRELVAAAEHQKAQIEFQNVEALANTAGILTSIPPLPALKVGQRVTRLEGILKKAKDAESASDPIVYRDAVREFYGVLRSTWERSVEELLFNQVVQRLEKEVRTMSLDGVNVDSESVTAVFDGMRRASAMIEAHDHAYANNTALPTSGDLSNDLDLLKTFIAMQKAKIKAAEKQNAHLKK